MSNITQYASLIISAGALGLSIYNFFRSRLDITMKRFSEIHAWHNRCVQVLIELKHAEPDDKKSLNRLATLSALIEEGRFYFPNILISSDTNSRKPLPYRGLRHNCLDFLVFAYRAASEKPHKCNQSGMDGLQREFTGAVFNAIKPYNLIAAIHRHSGNNYYKKISFEDYFPGHN